MSSLNMNGSRTLDSNIINRTVRKTLAANYALGYTNTNKKFVAKYIDRSDSDLKARLLSHVSNGRYKEFKKLDKDMHSDRPSNSKNWKLISCGQDGSGGYNELQRFYEEHILDNHKGLAFGQITFEKLCECCKKFPKQKRTHEEFKKCIGEKLRIKI